jgi:hypothetical protein
VLSHENPRLPAEGAGSSRLRAVFRASKKLYVFDKNNSEYCEDSTLVCSIFFIAYIWRREGKG